VRSKKALKDIAKRYIEALLQEYPSVEVEPVFEPVEGHDLWIRVEVPAESRKSLMKVLDCTTELNERFWHDDGVAVTSTVVDKEAAFL
jgi:hypothetical protein